MDATKPDEYGDGPCYPELAAIILVGILHVVTELGSSPTIATLYNVIVSIAFVAYLIWRVRRSSGAVRAWGMRTDNFWPAFRLQLVFGAIGAAILVGYGIATGELFLPQTFWMTVGIYPIWGIAQQFALQNFIARNLTGVLSNPIAIAVTAAVLFGAVHYPRLELVILAGSAGVFLTWLYRRIPNLWAVGIVHGVLGSLAYYVILKEDPGAIILNFLTG